MENQFVCQVHLFDLNRASMKQILLGAFLFFLERHSPNNLLSSVLTAHNCFPNFSQWVMFKSIYNIAKGHISQEWPHEVLHCLQEISASSNPASYAGWSDRVWQIHREYAADDAFIKDIMFHLHISYEQKVILPKLYLT